MPRHGTYSPERGAGNRPQRYTSGTEDCPFWVEAMTIVLLSASVDTSMAALLPERVMVRAVDHWSNTTSLPVHQCSNWRN
jgi:hypothetical protein